MIRVIPGSTWRDRNPSSGPVDLPDWRRVVHVKTAEDFGFVEGVGVWQHLIAGRWADHGAARKTRVRYNLFTQRYDLVEEPA
jgi:hypothetical protein